MGQEKIEKGRNVVVLKDNIYILFFKSFKIINCYTFFFFLTNV